MVDEELVSKKDSMTVSVDGNMSVFHSHLYKHTHLYLQYSTVTAPPQNTLSRTIFTTAKHQRDS